MTRDERAALRKDKPTVWVPVDPGDTFDGEVVEVASAWSDVQYDGRNPNSGFYPLLRVKVNEATGYKADEVLAVHGFATVLRDRILTQQPAPGERVVFTYDGEGEQKQKGRTAPQLYTLQMPERDPAEAAAKVYGTMSARRSPGQPEGQRPLPETVPGGDESEQDIPF